MIFARRHAEDIRELTDSEKRELQGLTEKCMCVLDRLYEPQGYNIGCNIGEASGASIPHLHIHVVPRYRREIGFVDILAGAKNYVEDPHETLRRLREEFSCPDNT